MSNKTAALIKIVFDSYYETPLDVCEEFANLLVHRHYGKNEIIKDEDKVEGYLNILLKGSAGIFFWKENNMVCLDLWYENEFFGDYMSFVTQKSTELFTQALEPLHMVSMSYKNLNYLYETSKTGTNIGRIAAESLFVHKQAQQIDFLKLTAEERYLKLLKRSPKVVQRTPQKYIAFYLGVAPESLSRIRKKISSKLISR